MTNKGIGAVMALTVVCAISACNDNKMQPPPIVPVVPTPQSISLIERGRFTTGQFDVSAAEIPAFDPASRRVFVVNGADSTVDILSIANISAPAKVGTLNISTLGASPNSVSVRNGIVAVAVQAEDLTAPGAVGLFRASDGMLLGRATVGALPDMLTFTPDGNTVLVANEGEPNDLYTVDPEGSVSVIDVRNPAAPVVRTAGFGSFDSQAAALRAQGVRLFGPNASVSQDVEPEYIAVSPDGLTAMVGLQEANAFARLDIASATITAILPLGFKDHSVAGQGFDPSDRDGASNATLARIVTVPTRGMYMPDTIASYSAGGNAFYVTANEGDAREYPRVDIEGGPETGEVFAEELRLGNDDYVLDPVAFPNAAELKSNAQLGRLNVTTATGDTDGDGDFDQIYSFGARSFSIFNANGGLVFDSGDDIEERMLAIPGLVFNAGNTDNDLDSRSDAKGPEPEALAVFGIGSKTFAAIGLERQGGILLYDITTPTAPSFLNYTTNRRFMADDLEIDVTTNGAADGDLGPEGIVFVPAADSPSNTPLLIVASEVSGTTTIYEIAQQF